LYKGEQKENTCRLVAALALVLTFTTQWVYVSAGAQGNWTALYRTGNWTQLPSYLDPEDVVRFPDDPGYDGQFYHLIAHDPWLTRGTESAVDDPRLRWRRILLPGLAWLLSFGSDVYVDSIYFALQLAFTALGAGWLAKLSPTPWLGLTYLIIPAVLVSLERMTVDGALAALTLGMLFHAGSGWIYPILVAAPLVRETGAVLVAAYVVHAILKRQWRHAAAAAVCVLPAVAWWLFVAGRTEAGGSATLANWPFAALVARTSDPFAGIPRTTDWLRTAATLEAVALAGLWAALAATLWLLWRRDRSLPAIGAYLFAAFASLLGHGPIWADAYAFGRTLAPWLIFLAILGLSRRWLPGLLPVALIAPRIVFQVYTELKRVL
jgi:hypothetical protein